jgi:hypothetical protein
VILTSVFSQSNNQSARNPHNATLAMKCQLYLQILPTRSCQVLDINPRFPGRDSAMWCPPNALGSVSRLQRILPRCSTPSISTKRMIKRELARLLIKECVLDKNVCHPATNVKEMGLEEQRKTGCDGGDQKRLKGRLVQAHDGKRQTANSKQQTANMFGYLGTCQGIASPSRGSMLLVVRRERV